MCEHQLKAMCLLTGKVHHLDKELYVRQYDRVLTALHFDQVPTVPDNGLSHLINSDIVHQNPYYRFVYLFVKNGIQYLFDRKLEPCDINKVNGEFQ